MSKENRQLETFIKESINHYEILDTAIKNAKNPDDVPLVETLHQNIAHMTVALKEVETRMIRVVNKMNRLGIHESDMFVLPLAHSVAKLKEMILKTEDYLNIYDDKNK